MRLFVSLFCFLMLASSAVGQSATYSILDKDDLIFLKELTWAVLDSSKINPGDSISPLSGKNNTRGILIRPGGRDDYPAFWIRDYAMALGTGMITAKEQKHLLLLTATTQCDQSWITRNGSLIPIGSVADHIRMDNSLPVYFPGTYSYEEQGNKEYGMVPPFCDEFYFIDMAYYYVTSSADWKILSIELNGKKLIDRLELAFGMPTTKEGQEIVYTTDDYRGVDFGFRDGIQITGELCFPSILKFHAAKELAELFMKLNNKVKAKKYIDIAGKIQKSLPGLFLDKNGMLRASTGKSGQPDVWATALAVYYKMLEGEDFINACKVLNEKYLKGDLAYKGNIRHVPLSDDFNNKTSWEGTDMSKNRYQNGAYWGTATGWVCYAIAKVDTASARKLAKDYIADLRDTDFRKGTGFGGPYECFFPPSYKQNPLYLATVACPYIVFKSSF